MNIMPLALLTFKEGVRHKIIFTAFLASLITVFLSVFLCGLYMRDLLKVLLDICLGAITVSGLLVPFFLTTNQLSDDIEKKVVYSILSRPVSRSNYIMGRFAGLTLLSLVLMLILLAATVVSILLAQTLYADFIFESLSWTSIIEASFLAFLGICILNAVAVLWSCITTSSFLATLLTIAVYIIGHTLEDLVKFIEVQGDTVQITASTKAFLSFLMFVFPNLSALDTKQLASYGLSIPMSEAGILAFYSFSYCAVFLVLAIFFFKKRDL